MRHLGKTLCALAVATGSVGAVTTAAPAPAQASTTCYVSTFHSHIREVTAQQQTVLTHLSMKTYAGRTTITRSSQRSASHRTTLRAALSVSYFMGTSAGATFAKVVKAGAETKLNIDARTSFGHTATTSVAVSSGISTTIPAGVSVAWFRGYQKVYGTFQYSMCNRIDGTASAPGSVVWRNARWWSYAYKDDGAQRCDIRAYTRAARLAKQTGCI